MAVYQGARPAPRGMALPWSRPDADPRPLASPTKPAAPAAAAHARRTRRSKAAARSRVGRQPRVSMALAGIVIAFSVGFVSLSQSVRVAATSYDIVRLQAEHDRLAALEQQLRSDVQRLQGEPAIRKEALDAGLGQLGAPVVLPAR